MLATSSKHQNSKHTRSTPPFLITFLYCRRADSTLTPPQRWNLHDLPRHSEPLTDGPITPHHLDKTGQSWDGRRVVIGRIVDGAPRAALRCSSSHRSSTFTIHHAHRHSTQLQISRHQHDNTHTRTPFFMGILKIPKSLTPSPAQQSPEARHSHHPIPPTSYRTTVSQVWVAHDFPNLHLQSLALRWVRVAVEVAVRGPLNGERVTEKRPAVPYALPLGGCWRLNQYL